MRVSQSFTIAPEHSKASMAWVLFLLFVALPIAEIAVFIKAGDLVGLWPTIGLVILTAAIGAALARSEGKAAMQRLTATIESGGQPVGPLLDAAAIFVGGILLLTPGFITDLLGLSLLFRPTRLLWGWAFVRLRGRRGGGGDGGGKGPIIIEGEYIARDRVHASETDPDPKDPRAP